MTDRPFDIEIGSAEATERGFMQQVYLWMSLGLALTGAIAWAVANNPSLMRALLGNSFGFLFLVIAQLGLVFWLSAAISRISLTAATIGFSVYATLNGVILSTIFIVYAASSIASTFFITAGTFAAVSIYGFTTKQNLTSIGSFSFMALIGIIIASLVNMFLKSPAIEWIISYAGVAIFIGLTAYDTQKLKAIHQQGFSGGEMMQKLALLGALTLYLDFINLFMMLLRIIGRRRD